MNGYFAPFQGLVVSSRRDPRALPWAALLQPVPGEESVFRRPPHQDEKHPLVDSFELGVRTNRMNRKNDPFFVVPRPWGKVAIRGRPYARSHPSLPILYDIFRFLLALSRHFFHGSVRSSTSRTGLWLFKVFFLVSDGAHLL
jgi:hypothetical protein